MNQIRVDENTTYEDVLKLLKKGEKNRLFCNRKGRRNALVIALLIDNSEAEISVYVEPGDDEPYSD